MKDSILLFVVLFPFVCSFVSYLIGKKNKILRDYFVSFVCIVELMIMAVLFYNICKGTVYNCYINDICGLRLHFQLDGFRVLYATICALMWTMTSLFSPEYFKHYRNRNRYFFFLLLTFSGTLGVFLSGNLYTTFIFFELMSMASYVSVIHDEKPQAMKAGETYLMIAVLGGMVMLMGLFIMSNALSILPNRNLAAVGKFLEIDFLYEAVTQYISKTNNINIIWASSLCMLFGFGAKAGMFFIHIWLPKAHPVAPAPASALLSGILTKSGIYGILIISSCIFYHNEQWGQLILYLGVLTMFVGALLALFSIDLKRTLACSSMSQIGFILVGVGMQTLLGHHNTLAIRGIILHMVNHSMFKLILFMCAGVIYMNTHKLNLNDIRGFGINKPLLQLSFQAGYFGIIGLPLFSGYISKTLLHESIVEYIEVLNKTGLSINLYKIIEWIFLISGGLTVAYMTKLYVCIFCEENSSKIVQKKYNFMNTTYMNSLSKFAIGVSALITYILGINAFFEQVVMKNIHNSNSTFMDKLATIGQGFMYGKNPAHTVNYYSLINLKGALISLAIGIIIYLIIIRPLLMKRKNRNTIYIDRWPKSLDLEDRLYRPILFDKLMNLLLFLFRKLDKLIDSIVVIFNSYLNLLNNCFKDKDTFLFLSNKSKSSKNINKITNTLSICLLLFSLGLFIALIFLVMHNI